MQKDEKERQKMQEKEHQKELQENLQIMLRKTNMERKWSLAGSRSAKGVTSIHTFTTNYL